MQESKITLSTLLPIGMVLTLASGVWWAADLNARVRQVTEDLSIVRVDVAAIRDRLGPARTASTVILTR